MRHGGSGALTGWRFDRRTFLKALGLGGLGLAAAGGIGSRLIPLVAPAAAQTSAIDDLALQLRFDPERIFRFVADQIRYQPYAGLLRGPEGTLMARAGNSVDQASLLAALLRASGVECRFAQGPIDPAMEEAIVRSGASDRATTYDVIAAAIAGTGEGARPFTMPRLDEGVRQQLEAASAAAGDAVAWVRTELESTAALITSALANAGISLPEGFGVMPAEERGGHVWVQAASGPAWLDLDPSIPAATPGEAPAVAASLVEELPDEVRHRVTFAVVSETVSGGTLQEETLLQVDQFADALSGLAIGVLNIEQQGLKSVGAAIDTGLEGGAVYLPCLVLGEEIVVGPGVLRFGGSGSGPFDVSLSASSSPDDGEPTAEWVQVTIASPGADPVVLRREMFDRIGPAARASGTPDLTALPPIMLTEGGPDSPPEFMPARRTHWLMVHPGTLGGEALRLALDGTETDERLATVPVAYQVLREAAGAEVGLPAGVNAFVDRPNVVAFTVDQERDADGALSLRSALDIWHRSFASTPVSDVAPIGPPNLIAGVLAHIVERLMAGEASDGGMTSTLSSVGRVFSTARDEGVRIRVLRAPEEVEALPFGPDAKARLRAAIGDGVVAVVPEASVRIGEADRVGWWLVDPATGSAVDQMDDGRGVAAEEAVTIRMVAVRAVTPMRDLGLCVGLAVLLAAVAIAGFGAMMGGMQAGGFGGGLATGLGAVATVASLGAAGGLVAAMVDGGPPLFCG